MSDLISVIMPVYNGSRFLRDSVNSVLRQTHPNWELIIVDDGSMDDTAAIMRTYTDARIRCFFQPSNLGVSAARNVGLSRMTGDYFCFLDCDDYLTDHSLESRLKVFKTCNSSFVDGAVQVVAADLSTLFKVWVPTVDGDVFKELCLLTGRCFFGPTWMVKTSVLKNIKFDETLRYAEDLWFYIQLAANGEVYRATSEVILKYRKHGNSAMSNLAGLALGYGALYKKIKSNYRKRLGRLPLWYLNLRIKKIMFLSFVAARQWRNAFVFLMKNLAK